MIELLTMLCIISSGECTHETALSDGPKFGSVSECVEFARSHLAAKGRDDALIATSPQGTAALRIRCVQDS